MPIRQRTIRKPVFIGASCSHVHFRRCLSHVFQHASLINRAFVLVQMMDPDLLLRLTDAALRQSLSPDFVSPWREAV